MANQRPSELSEVVVVGAPRPVWWGEDAENLLVPVCLAASQVAFGSVRMEPTLTLLGYAAGLAAAHAARGGVAVQDVDVAALQRALLDDGRVLSL